MSCSHRDLEGKLTLKKKDSQIYVYKHFCTQCGENFSRQEVVNMLGTPKASIIELFDEVLSKYEDSCIELIHEYSCCIEERKKELDKEITEYKRRFIELSGGKI